MPDDTIVDVDDIVVPRKRMRKANHIEALGESIRHNGLLHPITLRRAGSRLILVAGQRRLKAVKYLRQEKIRAIILDVSEVEALLIEIDENLQRAELTELQRAEHVAERKKIWESLYPQTKHGGAPVKKGPGGAGKRSRKNKVATVATLLSVPISTGDQTSTNGHSLPAAPSLLPMETPVNAPPDPIGPTSPAPQAFVPETASQTQYSERTVQRLAQIGEQICRAAKDLLEGSIVEDKQNELLKITKLDHEMQVQVAQLLHDGKATSVLRAKKMLEREAIEAEPQPLPDGPFRVIVADPPWHYHNGESDPQHRGGPPYATMSVDEIKALEVEALAADDAILWLWTTNAHLPEAFGVMRAWGFSYKTMLTWDKVVMGHGDWLRGQTEHCLLCIRGKPSVVLTNQTTLIREQRSAQHSQKPEAFYALVESLCAGSKVELFARTRRDGWIAWGHDTREITQTSTAHESEQTLLLTVAD